MGPAQCAAGPAEGVSFLVGGGMAPALAAEGAGAEGQGPGAGPASATHSPSGKVRFIPIL